MKKKTFGCLIGALVLVLAASIFVNMVLLLVKSAPETTTSLTFQPFQKISLKGSDDDNQIAVIRLYGVISYGVPGNATDSMVDDIVHQLRQVREDRRVKAVIVRIDSPGGEVTASDVIYNAIKKTDDVKPVIVFMDSVAASGGYYSAVGGRYLMANETTITGSIGVIIQTYNLTEVSEKIGFRVLTLTSGDMKDILNPFREPREEELEFVQGLIDESYFKFLDIVAREREMDPVALRQGVADGRILSGSRALKAGLIDGTGYFEDSITKAREIAELESDAEVIYLQAPFNLSRFFRILGQASSKAEVNVRLQTPGWESSQLQPGRPYYLSPHLWAGSR
jgi:protease-4